MGIFFVALLITRTADEPTAKITSTLRRTNLGRILAEPIVTPRRISLLNNDVLSLNPAEFAQALPEYLWGLPGPTFGRNGTEFADPEDPPRRLRRGGERRQEREEQVQQQCVSAS